MIPLEYFAGAAAVIAVTAYIFFGSDISSSKKSLSAYSDSSIPTSGLMNLGRTCFFNAVLQALASCPSFCSWINIRAQLAENNGRFIELLKFMINDLSNNQDGDSTHNTVSLSSLLEEIRTQGWVVENSEHDAHELFQAIMNLLHSDSRTTETVGLDFVAAQTQTEEDASNYELSIAHKSRVQRRESTNSIRSPVIGYTASNMTCRTCMKKSSSKYDMFTSLSLTFPPTTRGIFQLDDLLKFYFLSDSLSDVNCENCTRAHKRLIKSDFLKEISLGRIPKCLCLHIQRLGWYGHYEAVKRHDKIVFPSLLDLGSLTQLNSMLKTSARNLASSAFSGDNNTEKKKSASAPIAQYSNWYRLVALIEHQGSESSGHFVTYRRVGNDSDRWIYTSDLNVREVTAERVHNIAPYMLFYEKYDINESRKSEEEKVA